MVKPLDLDALERAVVSYGAEWCLSDSEILALIRELRAARDLRAQIGQKFDQGMFHGAPWPIEEISLVLAAYDAMVSPEAEHQHHG